ncbi:MAG: FAD-dependent oxidoreductase [Gaiellaceae bacterium]
MKVAVVGAGVMGLAAARALARDGADVAVHEQFQVGHIHGSSHGRSRIFRLAYPEAEWVSLAQEALPLWRELEQESGERLLELPGIVEIVDDLDESSRPGLEACGVPWEELEPDEVADRFDVSVPPGWKALLQPEAGFVRADRALAALRAGAERAGARIEQESRLAALDELDADVVVVTAGAWARELLAAAGIELPVKVTRETVAYFRLDRETPVPSVVRLIHRGHGFYSLHDPTFGLKVGHHHAGPVVTKLDEDGRPDPETVAAVAEWAGETFRLSDPEPASSETCLYTTTADERFVLERHGRIVVGSACSGHGFKFAPVIGKRLAELAG